MLDTKPVAMDETMEVSESSMPRAQKSPQPPISSFPQTMRQSQVTRSAIHLVAVSPQSNPIQIGQFTSNVVQNVVQIVGTEGSVGYHSPLTNAVYTQQVTRTPFTFLCCMYFRTLFSPSFSSIKYI